VTDDSLPGGWGETLADLQVRRTAARAMGGEERLAKHHDAGKLDARARVEHLLDPGSFREIGTLAGDVPADAIVAGSGRIGGRHVMVGAEDFTTVAGTIGGASHAKRYRIAELALRDHIPLIMLLEGAGHRQDGKTHSRSPVDLLMQAQCSGRVPMVTAVLGPSAGHGALIAPMSDFAVMSREASVFTAGPPVVAESLGETVSKDELGGPGVAVGSGLIHNVGNDDPATLDLVRLFLSYFPSSAWSYPPYADTGDIEPRDVPELLEIVPRDGRRTYDMHDVIDTIVDYQSWFEVQPGYGRSVLCVLARLGGHPVAIVANQPSVSAGSIDADGADKAAHFITVADSYHLPLVFVADNPGVLPGTVSERQGILRSGARMFAAQTAATTPKLQVTLRKAYGFGSMVMSMVGYDGQSGVFAFPGATLGAMGAAAMARSRGSDTDESELLRTVELEASYRSAMGLGFDELLDPRETRSALLDTLSRALSRRQAAPEPVSRFVITP